MKLTLGKDRKLRDESGAEVGELLALELELRPRGPFPQLSISPSAPEQSSEASEKDSGTATYSGRAREEDSADGGQNRTTVRSGQPDHVADVWAHYVAVMRPRDGGLHPDARRLIREALKCATVTELKRAIDGCASSDFHMGKNDRGRKYNKLPQILKARRGHNETTRDRIDFFLDLAEQAGVSSGLQSGVPSVTRDRISQAKRDIWDALDFPGDIHVQDRGREAEEFLRSVGITFDRQNRRFLETGDEAAPVAQLGLETGDEA